MPSDFSWRVAGLWRYPVKSMRGEQLDTVRLTPDGVEGDRTYAFESEGAPAGMLRLTGSERRNMLRFAASGIDPVRVLTPAGALLAVDDPALIAEFGSANRIMLTRSQVPQTDCRPLSMISLETIAELGVALGRALDPRQFRANLYLAGGTAFAEDALAGETLRVGSAVIRVTERDPRCRFASLNPETTEPDPELMKLLDRRHQQRAGVYAVVERPGVVTIGDSFGRAAGRWS